MEPNLSIFKPESVPPTMTVPNMLTIRTSSICGKYDSINIPREHSLRRERMNMNGALPNNRFIFYPFVHGVWKLQKKSHSLLRFWRAFENLKFAVKQCYETVQFKMVKSAKIGMLKYDIFWWFSNTVLSYLHTWELGILWLPHQCLKFWLVLGILRQSWNWIFSGISTWIFAPKI